MADKEIVINIKQQGALKSLASVMGNGSKSDGGGGGMLSSLVGSSGGTGGSGGGISGMLGGMSGALTGILAAVGGIAILVQSSKLLQMTIGRLMKMFMLLVRPIGDMLAVLLMPLMMLIRPLSLFVNAMFRPFIREARNAFRTGMRFFSMGMTEKGTDAMFTGLQLMAAPFLKLLVIAIGEGMKLYVDIIFAPIEMFLRALNGLGLVILQLVPFSEQAQEAWSNFMGGIIEGTNAVKTMAKDNIDIGITGVLDGIDAWAEGLIEHSTELASQAELSKEFLTVMEENGVKAATMKDTMVKLDTTTKDSFTDMLIGLTADSTIFGTAFPDPINSALDSLVEKARSTKAEIDGILSDAMGIGSSIRSYASKFSGMNATETWDATKGAFVGKDYSSGKGEPANDFIWRAGQGVQQFSSSDNLIGTKDELGGSGVTINIGTIEATDPSGVKRVLDEMIQENMSKLR